MRLLTENTIEISNIGSCKSLKREDGIKSILEEIKKYENEMNEEKFPQEIKVFLKGLFLQILLYIFLPLIH